jgi:hypothetical protein
MANIPNIKTTIRKNNLGEYVVRLHVGGVWQKESNYYTNDKQDAADTARKMEDNARTLAMLQWSKPKT